MTKLLTESKNGIKLRKLGNGLQKQIEQKSNPGIGQQVYTERRARIAAEIMREGEKLLKTQQVLFTLADMWDNVTIPSSLMGILDRETIKILLFNLRDGKYPDYSGYIEVLRKAKITLENFEEVHELITAMADKKLEALGQFQKEARLKSLIGSIPGFFPTPLSIVRSYMIKTVCDLPWLPLPLDQYPNLRMLEPSAGTGNIIKEFLDVFPLASVTAVEANHELAGYLGTEFPLVETYCKDFLEATPERLGKFQLVLMNPPFEKKAWIKHIQHAYNFLDQDNRFLLLSIVPGGEREIKDTKFAEWLDGKDYWFDGIPANSFKESRTGVNTSMLGIKG